MGTTPMQQIVRAELAVPGMLVQLRTFHFGDGLETVVCEEEHLLSLKLSPAPPMSEGRFVSRPWQGQYGGIGDLLLVPGRVPLDSRVPAGGTLSTVYCSLNRQAFGSLTGRDDDWNDHELASCLDVRSNLIKEALRRLAMEAVHPGFASTTLADALRITVTMELARYLAARAKDGLNRSINHANGVLSPRQMRQITECIEDLQGCTPTVSEIADLCGISTRHFTRLFRQTTGQSVLEFVNARRLERAQSYLADTALALKEIAWRLGFSDPSSFSRAFRKLAGETPQDYRLRTRIAARPQTRH